MATADLRHSTIMIDTSNDSIVIVDNFQSIRGGFTLDVTGFTPLIIYAGHPVIEETSSGNLKPMPISGSSFAALPAGHTYAGVVINTTFTDKPMKGIMIRGTVNHVAFTAAATAGQAGYYSYASILTGIKAALFLIDFRGDR